jgi:AsmA protein
LQWDGGPLNPLKGNRLRDFREWGGKEHMASATVRRSIWALAAAIVLAGIIFVATPYVASTRIVRDRIAKEIGAWSGYSVDIGAPPVIEIWPRLRAVLTNVTFSDREAQPAGAVGKVERMEIELSPMAAMRGDAVFTAARLVRPTLTVHVDAQGGLLWTFGGKGRFWTAVERARAAMAEDLRSAMGTMPSDPFGSVQISEGQVLVMRDGKEEPLLSGVEAVDENPGGVRC